MALERVEAPIPGKILSVDVKVGSMVKEGDAICRLESMKMEVPITAPLNGVVKELHISPEQIVRTGNLLAVIEF
ncbi:MAG: acetyl-CoA carboxylase biotin carboxyl carrier protein subunit [Chloroflexi bacterium]|nr:acetyl-CoA carboxylase biotin carboxyl carrier protein subunit [Chloroflexota bacterium]